MLREGGGCWWGRGCLLGWSAPLGRRVALTLALSRRAGEGTVVGSERVLLRLRGVEIPRCARNDKGQARNDKGRVGYDVDRDGV